MGFFSLVNPIKIRSQILGIIIFIQIIYNNFVIGVKYI
jgi:hypothetical protein